MGGLVSEAGSLLGGGDNNQSFTAKSANLQGAATTAQANTAYDQTQDAIAQQKALATALAAQNGVANQSSVYNQQQSLADALKAQANGTAGPSVADTQLNAATGTNVANESALMAGQRGSGTNVGLIAREAAQQGARTQQQGVGQAATLTAQEKLNATNALQAQQTNMANTAGAQVGEQANATMGLNQAAQGQQSNILNSISGTNNSLVSNQSNMNNVNGAMSQTNANNSAKFVSGMANGAAGSAMGMMGGGAKGGVVEKTKITPPKGTNPTPAMLKKALPDHIRGIASIYHPHLVKRYALGGEVSPGNAPNNEGTGTAIANVSQLADRSASKPKDKKTGVDAGQGKSTVQAGGAGDASPASDMPDVMYAADGGEVESALDEDAPKSAEAPAESTPAEDEPKEESSDWHTNEVQSGEAPNQVGSASAIANASQVSSGGSGSSGGGGGGMASMLPMLAMLANKGAVVPGKVNGKKDSIKNDTVPAMLSAGEIVLPLHVTQSDDPVKASANFVKALLEKNGTLNNHKEKSEFHKALKTAMSQRKK